MLADARQHGLNGAVSRCAGTGHALERDVVHIAAGNFCDLRHALRPCWWAQQEDQVHLALSASASRPRSLHAFFGRVVHDQHAVHASGRRVAHECVGLPCFRS
jgi:hypothetical protein